MELIKTMYNKLINTLFIVIVCFYSITAQENQLKYSLLTDLKWEVSAIETTYHPGGIPISFNFRITNTTSFPTRKYDGFGFHLEVTHKGETTKFTRLTDYTNDIMFINKAIAPNGGYFEFTRRQSFNLSKIFKEDGDYELTFIVPYEKLNGELGEFRTNTITIKSEVPKKEEKAYNKLKSISSEFMGINKIVFKNSEQYNDDFLYKRLIKTEIGVERLVNFGYEFPNSVYGQFALCIAARWYQGQGKPEKVKEILAKLEKIDKSPTIAAEISQNKKN